jgi:hypothetical protein
LIDGRTSLFSDYVGDRLGGELRLWDVVLPLNAGRSPKASSPTTVSEMSSLPLRARNKGLVKKTPGGATFKPMGDKNRISDPNEDPPMLLDQARREKAAHLRADGELKGDRAYCHLRERPLLMVHLFKVNGFVKDLEMTDVPIASLSFQMPKSSIQAVPKSYEVNPVYQRQIEAMVSEIDDDEGPLE